MGEGTNGPSFDQLFTDISRLRVAVVGDVMLDTYWWGGVDRISPEGPVPVVALAQKRVPHRRRRQCGAQYHLAGCRNHAV